MKAVDSGLLQDTYERRHFNAKDQMVFSLGAPVFPPLLNDELDLSDMFLKEPKKDRNKLKNIKVSYFKLNDGQG